MRPAFGVLTAILIAIATIAPSARPAHGGEPNAAPATQEATKTYTFRGHTIVYPQSWQLREKGGGGPATIYKPAPGGGDATTATWDFDRKADRQGRTAEKIRDDVAAALAETMKGFELKEKGALKVDGKAAAFVTFKHSTVEPAAVARQVFVPTGDGFMIVIAESAVADTWETTSPQLDRITRSLRFPR